MRKTYHVFLYNVCNAHVNIRQNPYCQADASEKLQANVQINKTTCVSSMDLAMEESRHLVIHLLKTNLVLPTNAEAEAYWEALANQFASDQEADQ